MRDDDFIKRIGLMNDMGGHKLMNKDITLPLEDGIVNLRVGAIIQKDGKILMVGNKIRPEYLFSVGGRIKFGETAEDAVKREVFEETGIKMDVLRLGFIHENFFYGDSESNFGKLIYEISFFFYMKVPSDFNPVGNSFTEDNHKEFLFWIDPNDDIKYYPKFFKEELNNPQIGVKHFVTDEREESKSRLLKK